MQIGIPREGGDERRVSLTPAGVKALTGDGHDVLVQTGAGEASGFLDEAYQHAGARLTTDAAAVRAAEMVVAIDWTAPAGSPRRQIVLAYLHAAARPWLVDALAGAESTAIGLDLIRDHQGERPLLAVMSRLAGQAAIRQVTKWLDKPGARAVSWGATPGRIPRQVVVAGAGAAGTSAAWMALALGCRVLVTDPDGGRRLQLVRHGAQWLDGGRQEFRAALQGADGVVIAAAEAGGKAPPVLDSELVDALEPGTVVVDLAITDGGGVAGLGPTRLGEPPRVLGAGLGLAVPNWAAWAPQPAAQGLTLKLTPLVRRIAAGGIEQALMRSPGLAAGLVVHHGRRVQAPSPGRRAPSGTEL
ncbi:MAG: hypothetical protein M0Z53_09990 [Thermaerobacter sp.]|nr:hypothetical protein [Thermaerobacter sp.]